MRWSAERVRGVPALVAGFGLWLLPMAPVLAQDATDLSTMMEQLLRSAAIWSLVVVGVYIVCLALMSRAAGLDGGLFAGCLATLLGVLLGAAALVPMGWYLGDRLNQMMWSVIGQVLGLAALGWGIKIVFGTDWARAILTLLLTCVLVLTISGVVLLVVF